MDMADCVKLILEAGADVNTFTHVDWVSRTINCLDPMQLLSMAMHKCLKVTPMDAGADVNFCHWECTTNEQKT